MDAVEKTSGPCIILAGAGTGKTRVIVNKIKHLVDNKVYSPEKIVCITFSNEAANNVFSRVKSAISVEGEPIIKTFHAFSSDLLREHGHLIGIKKDFSVMTPDESKIMLHKCFSTSPIYCHKYINTISTCKDLGISDNDIEDYLRKSLKNPDDDLDEMIRVLHFELQGELDKDSKKEFNEKLRNLSVLKDIKKFLNVWRGYEKLKERDNYQDYSDLNNHCLELLKKHPEIAGDFDYIFVDEFQDTNKVQLELLKFLAVKKNITVVGDLNQSIYRFRGAYKENLKMFKEFFHVPDEDIFTLDKSYRSPNSVLNVAHQLISNNYSRKEDCFEVLNAEGKEGEKVEVYEMKNAREEARKVCELVKKEFSDGKKYEDICVMFRTHQQGRIIKNVLEQEGIPFCSVTRKSLLNQSKIQLAICYLKVLELLKNKKGGGAREWWDLVYQQHLDSDDLIKIGRFIKMNMKADCLSEILFSKLKDMPLSAHGKTLMKILVEQLESLIPETDKKVCELVKEVYRVGGLNPKKDSENVKQDIIDLNKFYEIALNNVGLHHGELSSFVRYLDILDTLGINLETSDFESKGVRLMTSHATKGMEYDVVIITNFAQGRFPIEKVTRNSLIPLEVHPEFNKLDENNFKEFEKANQILEERRLAYVSFTRAREKLILTYAKNYASKKAFPSQFLNEINYMKNPNVSFFVDDDEKFKEFVKKGNFSFNARDFDSCLVDLCNGSKKKPKLGVLSPSSLLLFKECQKKFEYKYIYNMPEKKPISWEQMRLGSFVHLVLEKGVKNNFRTEKDFLDLVRVLHREEDWENVDLDEAIFLVRVFFRRNKDKYSKDSRTEQKLNLEINGIRFSGFADRIDFNRDGLEIIDYKTGKAAVPMMSRNLQLAYYALAASKIGKVCKVTLEMLGQDKSLEFELDKDGVARSVNGRVEFSLEEVKDLIVETAEEIKNCYDEGFKVCPLEKNCDFCDELFRKD